MRKPSTLRRGAVASVLCLVAGLAVCTGGAGAVTRPAGDRGLTVTAATIVTGGDPGPGSPFASGATDRAVARRAAPALLAALRLPPGAVASATEPAGAGAALARPGFALHGIELVDAHSWWTVDAPPGAVVATLRAHLPHGMRIIGTGLGGERGDVTDAFWSFSPPAGLSELSAAVQTVGLADGDTAIRLDGEATWLAGRPAWDRIPATVTSVTLTGHATPAGGPRGRSSTPRTLGRGDARTLAAAIDRLDRVQPGVTMSCPAAFAIPTLTLRFAGPGRRRRAVAVFSRAGCVSLRLRVGGRRGPALMDFGPRVGLALDDRLLALGAFRACRAGQITVSRAVASGDRRAATLLTVEVRNRSDQICTLRGFPRLALRSAGGHTLVRRDRDADPRTLRREGVRAAVILYPNGDAGFLAPVRSCARAAVATSARVELPGISRPLTARLTPDGRPLRPCAGALAVGALTSDP